MTTETIDIRIREDGSRVVKRNIDEIGDSAEVAAGSLDILKRAALLLGAAFSVQKLIEYTNVWTDLTSRLARFGGTAEGTKAVMARLMTIAQRTYAPIENISEIFLQTAFSLEQLGKSTQESLDYTEALTNALVISGAKGERQATVMNALSKAMLEGKLAGDNWNTVLTQGGRVVEALVDHTGKSLTELKAMASAGTLTADTVFTALTSQLTKLQEEADDMPATIGDAFVRMRNRVLQVVGELNEKLGASSAIVKLIDLVTTNLETLVPVLMGIGVAVGVAFVPAIVMAFAGALKALWIVVAANPLLALAALIAGVVTTLYMMRDQIKLGIDETTSLGDLMRAAWEKVGPAIKAVADFVKFVVDHNVSYWFGGMKAIDKATDESMGKQEASWLSLVRTVVQVFDLIGGTIRGTMRGILNVVGSVIDALKNNFEQLGNVLESALNLDPSGMKAALTSNIDGWKEAGSNIGSNFNEGFQQEMASQKAGGLESVLDGLIARAKELGLARAAAAAEGSVPTGGGPPPGPPVDPDAAKKAARELERLKDALARLRDQADPVGAAMRELAAAQETLNKSVALGLISQNEAVTIYTELARQMEAQLDPLGALNREIDENIALLNMGNRERGIEIELLSSVARLRRDGVALTAEETAALRAKLAVEQELARIAGIRDTMEANSSAGQDQVFGEQLAALSQLVASEKFTGADLFTEANNLLGGLLDETTEYYLVQQEQMAGYFARIDEMRSLDLISEKTASEAKRALKQAEMDANLAATSQALGAASGLMQSNSKKAFEVGRAAAIGQAIVNTYTGATAAFQSAASIPFVGWLMAPLAAAGAIAAGMAQVSAIRSQTMPAYRTGGEFMVGGSGGTDSQTVSLRATPGERISINTPAQARALERMGEKDNATQGNRRFQQTVNVVVQGKPDRQTPNQTARAVRRESTREFLK